MTKTLTPIELVAFGMRLATSDHTKLPDSVFVGELSEMFRGDSDSRKADLSRYLATIGVAWTSGPVIDAVAVAMASVRDRAAAAEMLRQARRTIDATQREFDHPNIAGADRLAAVMSALMSIEGVSR